MLLQLRLLLLMLWQQTLWQPWRPDRSQRRQQRQPQLSYWGPLLWRVSARTQRTPSRRWQGPFPNLHRRRRASPQPPPPPCVPTPSSRRRCVALCQPLTGRREEQHCGAACQGRLALTCQAEDKTANMLLQAQGARAMQTEYEQRITAIRVEMERRQQEDARRRQQRLAKINSLQATAEVWFCSTCLPALCLLLHVCQPQALDRCIAGGGSCGCCAAGASSPPPGGLSQECADWSMFHA